MQSFTVNYINLTMSASLIARATVFHHMYIKPTWRVAEPYVTAGASAASQFALAAGTVLPIAFHATVAATQCIAEYASTAAAPVLRFCQPVRAGAGTASSSAVEQLAPATYTLAQKCATIDANVVEPQAAERAQLH